MLRGMLPFVKLDSPAKQCLFATVRLEVETASGRSVGTAFVYQFHNGARQWNFLVTCRHVVENGVRAHLFFTGADSDHAVPTLGARRQIQVDNLEGKWFYHPDRKIDIAIAPIASLVPATGDSFVYLTAINEDALPRPQTWRELEVIEEVVFFGYPAGYYDHYNLLPIARRGITASPPHLDYDGRPEFLVDAAVYYGCSGSPVFIMSELPVWQRLAKRRHYRFVFLGVITEVLRCAVDGVVSFVHPAATAEGLATARLLNLGVVLKSHLVHDTAMQYIAAH
jgi:hypothetical protein